ncbi:MAG: hypothetical protein WBA57_09345 [Elainellaceae cyanobacterium]
MENILPNDITMNPKQELLQELETSPSPLIQEVLNFLRFLKTKQPSVDFMEFAGMAADDPDLINEIVTQTEIERAMDIENIYQ